MAATATTVAVAPVALSSKRSEISGGVGSLRMPAAAGLPSLPIRRVLRVEASGNKKKLNVKEPFGPSGGAKFKGGLDASGRKPTGKGVYQFSKKYGANVDGYSPIYTPAEWALGGDVYTGGQAGLTLWALTFGALLLVGAFLVYSTSALS
ncbi:unnamed protein product [Calypogeia fissa]